MKKSINAVLGIVIVLVILALVAYFLSRNTIYSGTQDLTNLTLCLADKATMYGAYWCPHCQNQKAMFGDYWSAVNYIECTEETEKCDQAGVKGYPTWIILGKSYSGEKSLSDLASLAGCEI